MSQYHPVGILFLWLSVLTVSVSIYQVESLPTGGSSVQSDGSVKSFALTPQNIAAIVGDKVVLECAVVVAPPSSRVMWAEYVTSETGLIISDNEEILVHPNSDRYTIIHRSEKEYSLEIRDLRLSDGGKYRCADTMASDGSEWMGDAELIVLESAPICSTSIPSPGALIEDQTYTVECSLNFQGKYAPSMTWSGPPNFRVIKSSADSTSLRSEIEITAERNMDEGVFTCVTDFKNIASVPPNTANNTPIWESIYSTASVLVNWEPRSMYIEPLKSRYSVGDVLTCHSYSSPSAFYQWLNTRTLEGVTGERFVVTESMMGYNQTLMCQAQNVIIDTIYSSYLLLDVFVPLQ